MEIDIPLRQIFKEKNGVSRGKEEKDRSLFYTSHI